MGLSGSEATFLGTVLEGFFYGNMLESFFYQLNNQRTNTSKIYRGVLHRIFFVPGSSEERWKEHA